MTSTGGFASVLWNATTLTSSGNAGGSAIFMSQITLLNTATVVGVTINTTGTFSGQVKAVIYDSTPSVLLASGPSIITSLASGYNLLPVTSTTLSAGTYYVGYVTGASGGVPISILSFSGTNWFVSSGASVSSPANPLITGGSSSNQIAVGLEFDSSTSQGYGFAGDFSTGITLSSFNTVATSTSSLWEAARSVVTQTSGKWYAEVIFTGTVQNISIGVCSALFNMSSLGIDIGGYQYAVLLYDTYCNGLGVTTGTLTPTIDFQSGDTIGIAIDIGNNLLWFNRNNSAWSGSSGTPNPVTGTGGISLTATGGWPMMITGLASETVAAFTLHDFASSQSYAPPSGFSSWSTGGPGAILEFGSASDTVSETGSEIGTIAESGSANVTVNFFTSTYVGVIVETGAANDTISDVDFTQIEAIMEFGLASDVIIVVNSIYEGVISETGSAIDSVSDVDSGIRTILESGSASDIVNFLGTIYGAIIVESGSTSDTVAVDSSTYVGIIIESGSAIDTANVGISTYNSISLEIGSANDLVMGGIAFPTISITEAGVSSDTTDILVEIPRYVGINWSNYSEPLGSDTGTTITVGSTSAYVGNGPIYGGDTLIVVVAVDWITPSDATTITMTSDWTNIYNYADTTIGMSGSVWYKTASDDETGLYEATWTNNSAGAGASWVIIDYAGIAASLDSSAGQQNHNTGLYIPAPSLVPISDGDTVICVWIAQGGSNPYEIMPGMNQLANTNSINVPEIMVAASSSEISQIYTATAGAAVSSFGISLAFIDPTGHVGFTPETGSMNDITDSVLLNGNTSYLNILETGDASDVVSFDSVSSVVTVYNVGSTAAWGNPVSLSGPIPGGSLIVLYATGTPTDTVGNHYTAVGDDIYYVPNCAPLSSTDSIIMSGINSGESSGYQRPYTFVSNTDAKFQYGFTPINQNSGLLSVLYATGINGDPYDSGFYNTVSGTSNNPSVTASASPVVENSLVIGFVLTTLTTFFDFTQDIINASFVSPPATAQTGSLIMFGGYAISSAQLTYAPSMNVSQSWQASILAFAPPQYIGSIFTGQNLETGSASDSSNSITSDYAGLIVETGTASDVSDDAASIFNAGNTEFGVTSVSSRTVVSAWAGIIRESGSAFDRIILTVPLQISALVIEIGAATDYVDEMELIPEFCSALDSTDSAQIAYF